MEQNEVLGGIQYVVFTINNQLYSFLIKEVVEILRVPEITPVPGTEEVIEGVINLRGSIIPVVNLHKRFQMPVPKLSNKKNRIVIVQGLQENIGLMVEEVRMVTHFDENDVEAPPEQTLQQELFMHFAKYNGQVIGVLNLFKVLYEMEK